MQNSLLVEIYRSGSPVKYWVLRLNRAVPLRTARSSGGHQSCRDSHFFAPWYPHKLISFQSNTAGKLADPSIFLVLSDSRRYQCCPEPLHWMRRAGVRESIMGGRTRADGPSLRRATIVIPSPPDTTSAYLIDVSPTKPRVLPVSKSITKCVLSMLSMQSSFKSPRLKPRL